MRSKFIKPVPRKKILISSHNLRLGGVERSLIGLLQSIDYSRFEVDLFLHTHDGELMKHIPRDVHLLPEIKGYSNLIKPAHAIIKAGQFNLIFAKYKAKQKAKAFLSKKGSTGDNMVYSTYMYRQALPLLPPISSKTYDLGISFLTPHFFCSRKASAKKRIAWIHTDYSKMVVDDEAEWDMWKDYDHIAAISEDAANVFGETFPRLSDKIMVIENILHPHSIHEQADLEDVSLEMTAEPNQWKIVSVGRFTTAKNFDNIPFIAKKILEEGVNIKWFIIGYGGDEDLILRNIKEAGMEKNVVILGKKANVYPYIKQGDIYVQPSRFEGKAVTVREAQILHKPVIITKFSTSSSQVKEGFDGLIVPLDNDGCASGIVDLIRDPKGMENLISNCRKSDFSNQREVEKVYHCVG